MNTPGSPVTPEPQEERGAPGSRDTGSDQPSGGPTDRPSGKMEGDESVPAHDEAGKTAADRRGQDRVAALGRQAGGAAVRGATDRGEAGGHRRWRQPRTHRGRRQTGHRPPVQGPVTESDRRRRHRFACRRTTGRSDAGVGYAVTAGSARHTPRGRDGAKTSADPSPLIARHVEVRAQRPPHVAGFDAVLDGLRGGPPAEAVSTWSTSSDRPRTEPNCPSTSSWNSVRRTRPIYAGAASASWHTRTGSATSPAAPGRAGGRRVARRGQHLPDRGGQPVGVQRPHQLRTALPHNAIGDLPLVTPTGHHHHRDPGQQCLGHHPVPAAADRQVGVPQQLVLAAQPDRRPRRHLAVRSGQPRHHHPRPLRQHVTRRQVRQRQFGQALGAGRRGRGRHHHQRPVPGGTSST